MLTIIESIRDRLTVLRFSGIRREIERGDPIDLVLFCSRYCYCSALASYGVKFPLDSRECEVNSKFVINGARCFVFGLIPGLTPSSGDH